MQSTNAHMEHATFGVQEVMIALQRPRHSRIIITTQIPHHHHPSRRLDDEPGPSPMLKTDPGGTLRTEIIFYNA